MPLTQTVSSKAVVQKNRRIHIPVVIRWRFKLESGEIFKVHLKLDHRYEDFYGRMSTDDRLTVPKVTAKEFLESEEESLNGYTAKLRCIPLGGKKRRVNNDSKIENPKEFDKLFKKLIQKENY